MAEDRGTLRAISWREVFPGLALFSALRMALDFRALLLAAVAIVGTTAGWILCGDIFEHADNPRLQDTIAAQKVWPWKQQVMSRPVGAFVALESWRDESPLLIGWTALSAPFEHVFSVNVTFTEFVYWLLCALWALVVWSFFGGAITRLAAVSFARQGENQSWKQLIGFVRSHWGGYFAAPLMPMLGAFLLAGFLAVVGVVMRMGGPGVLLVGAGWIVVLLVGFMMAFLLLGLFFGWPLMWGAVSAEGTDSFGALSHAYSYAYQRPLHYLLYAMVAAFIGVLGWLLVSLFAAWTISLGSWGVSWGSGTARLQDVLSGNELSSLENAGASMIHFWTYCIYTLAFAFVFSYLWTSTTVIYFLLRRQVDATEVDEVFMPEENELRGLPSLKTGPDGVPQVADDPVMAGEG